MSRRKRQKTGMINNEKKQQQELKRYHEDCIEDITDQYIHCTAGR